VGHHLGSQMPVWRAVWGGGGDDKKKREDCRVQREEGNAENAGEMTRQGWCGCVDEKSENSHWDGCPSALKKGRTGSRDVQVRLMGRAGYW